MTSLTLEGGRSICQPEWHDEILVVPVSGSERRLPFVPFGYAKKIISAAVPEVKGGDVIRT